MDSNLVSCSRVISCLGSSAQARWEDSLQAQSRRGDGAGHLGHLGGRDPQSRHPRVHLHVNAGDTSPRGLRDERYGVRGVDGETETLTGGVGDLTGVGGAQDQYRRGDPRRAQGQPLVNRGHAQPLRARPQCSARDGDRAVAVGVRLDDGHDPDPRPEARANCGQVARDGAEVHFRPGAGGPGRRRRSLPRHPLSAPASSPLRKNRPRKM